jgi:hypothetical protein
MIFQVFIKKQLYVDKKHNYQSKKKKLYISYQKSSVNFCSTCTPRSYDSSHLSSVEKIQELWYIGKNSTRVSVHSYIYKCIKTSVPTSPVPQYNLLDEISEGESGGGKKHSMR